MKKSVKGNNKRNVKKQPKIINNKFYYYGDIDHMHPKDRRHIEKIQKYLNKDDITDVIEKIKNKQYGVELQLTAQNLSEDQVQELIKAVEENQSITHIKFNRNNLSLNSIVHISKFLKTNPPLKYLSISDNKIGDRGAKLISESITNNTNLISLSLERIDIGDEGVEALAAAVSNNSSLKELILNDNRNIKNKGAVSLLKALKFNKAINKIYLTHNSITPNGILEAVEALQGLENRELEIRFSNTYFSKEKNDEIKVNLGKKLDAILQNKSDNFVIWNNADDFRGRMINGMPQKASEENMFNSQSSTLIAILTNPTFMVVLASAAGLAIIFWLIYKYSIKNKNIVPVNVNIPNALTLQSNTIIDNSNINNNLQLIIHYDHLEVLKEHLTNLKRNKEGYKLIQDILEYIVIANEFSGFLHTDNLKIFCQQRA